MQARILLLLISASVLALSSLSASPVRTAKEAKVIAEQETHGHAVRAHRIPLNGATCGWEVEVFMPNEDRGWRCIIDCDSRMVFRRDRIPNPQKARKKI